MNEGQAQIVEHYANSGLFERLESAIRADGADPVRPTIVALAPYDHDTRKELRSAGFDVEQVKDVLQRALDFGARSRDLVERGGKPPDRANALIHGDIAATTLANVARAYKEGSLVPIEVVARKR